MALEDTVAAIYADPRTKATLEYFTPRQRDRENITVRQINHLTEIPVEDILYTLRKLEEHGLGRFSSGANAYFTWKESMLNVARIVKGMMPKAVIDETPKDGIAESHTYLLRHGFEVKLKLPHDFTRREAERLSAFILTLPMD